MHTPINIGFFNFNIFIFSLSMLQWIIDDVDNCLQQEYEFYYLRKIVLTLLILVNIPVKHSLDQWEEVRHKHDIYS